MRAHADDRGPNQPVYGVPSPALLARAHQGYARFLSAPGGCPDAASKETSMPSTHTLLHDPKGRIEAELPLDRGPHEGLVEAVLAWNGDVSPQATDCEQIALQLTGAARAVADDVRRAAALLPAEHPARALAEYVLEEADRRLAAGLEGTLGCAQGRARLVRELYGRLDRLAGLTPHTATAP
ncbi:DUF6415 family natural product biosynthesis protein [Streptomyces sp. CB02959]|uniref:DUF6415 family natural product biosynthesis protein n=1 Tax=Streptomyces sp. CB02959 TaxID=2020330 RepID=UPI0026AB91AE